MCYARLFRILLSLFALFSIATAQDEPKRGPSTAEERTRFVALTRKLETNPLDKGLYAEKKWAKQWLDEVPDINVNVCAPLVFGADFVAEQYRYTPQLSYQVTFASAVFIIEHPDKKGDTTAQFIAGVESALKTYSALLKTDPDAKSKSLNGLMEKQKQGKLADFVRDASKPCEDKKEG